MTIVGRLNNGISYQQLMRKISSLWHLAFLFSLLPICSIHGRSKELSAWDLAYYDYFVAPNGGIVYCRIDKSSHTLKIGPYYEGCRFGDHPGPWGEKRKQGVKGNISLPSKVMVRHRSELSKEDVIIGEFTIVSLDRQAFKGCSELISITLPPSVNNISAEAFVGCSNLTTINLSSTIRSIDLKMAEGCSKLEAINVEKVTDGKYHSFDGILCLDGNTIYCPKAYKGAIRIPSHLSIGNETFKDCQSITEAIIEDGVKDIGSNAFENCSLLSRVEVPSSVRRIGEKAFNGCILLKDVVLGASIEEMGRDAFASCIALKEITLPQKLKYIDWRLLKGCSSLERVNISEGVRTIYGDAFSFCSSLREIKLPNTLESIGENAFMGCTALEKVILGPNVKNINRYAFFGCSSLRSINVPKQAVIYDETFMDCDNLQR